MEQRKRAHAAETERVCSECGYFRRHYIKFGENYQPAGCGHCVYPRLKHRSPDTQACFRFEPELRK